MEVKFYADQSKKMINAELFSSHAEEWAKKVCEAGVNTNPKTGKKKLEKNKISQVRKFYDEVIKFDGDLKKGEDYKLILPYLKMLNAKAAYAEGRKLVTDDFKAFINKSLAQLNDDPKSFELFSSFFEAFMGYYKYFESQYKDSRED